MSRSVTELIKLTQRFSLYSNRKSFNNLKRRFLNIFFFALHSFLFTYEGLFSN